jgi:glucose/arabinose dehydrogenase
MSPSRRPPRATLAALFSLVLAACGGSDSPAPEPPAPGPGAPPPVGSPGPAPSPNPGGDTQAPVATLTAPAHLADGLAGMVTLTAVASDDTGVAGVEFQVDGIALGAEDTAAPYAATLDTAALAAGQHVLRARARDAAGKRSPWSAATVRVGDTQPVAQGFELDAAWATGLGNATAFAQAPDGRWFVALQHGAVRVVKDGTLLPTPARTLFGVDSTGERGLIGIAVHPDFAANGWLYLHYTTTAGGTHNRIARIVVTGDTATGPETAQFDLPQLSGATNHNGGALHFDANRMLFVGVGDNAQGARAQDPSHPFGKLLRLNDDLTVPADNPFAGPVWALGLRNPFTFAIDPASGRLHINDVGENTWEEINLGEAGANYGWPGSEGPDDLGSGITGPLFAYAQAPASPPGSGPGGFFTGRAIAGGAFYPDTGNFPAAYHGNYFFADFASRFVARLDPANGAAYAFAHVDGNPVDLRAGLDGALYVLTRTSIERIGVP